MFAPFSHLFEMYSLRHPGYMHLKFQPLFWTTGQPRAFELCLGSSIHQSEYQIYIVRFPGGVRALDSAITVNKNLAARVLANIPSASTMEKRSGLC